MDIENPIPKVVSSTSPVIGMRKNARPTTLHVVMAAVRSAIAPPTVANKSARYLKKIIYGISA
jgi:hypothetical protein